MDASHLLARSLLLCCVLVLGLPLAVSQTSPSEGFEYRLVIDCPEQDTRCPVIVIDAQDALGDPALAVDPFQPRNLILASLHGSGDNPGAPTPKSRSGQTFTTHTSTNGGGGWIDKPFYPPGQVTSNGYAYGEHPAITLSPYGQVFVGSLFSAPWDTDGESGFDYVLSAQKFRSLRNINDNQHTRGDYNAQFLTSYYPGNAIQQMWYTFNPITDNMTIIWLETVTPYSSGATDSLPRATDTFEQATQALRQAREEAALRAGAGLDEAPSAAGPANDLARTGPANDLARTGPADHLLARTGPADHLLARTGPSNEGLAQADAPGQPAALADQQAQSGPRSVIGVAWTDLDPRGEYRFPERDQAIGPCEKSTNPVIKEGYLYIGCKVADEGTFAWNTDAEPGDIEMFRMHPDGGAPEYLGPAPISGGAPKLGVRSDGRVALMTVDVEDKKLVLDAAYGGLDASGRIAWARVSSYGSEVPDVADFDVVGANIQDMIYREYSGVIHMVLKRNLEREDKPGNVARPFDPTIHKAIVALDEKHGFLFYHDLDIGNIATRTQDTTLMGQPDAVYDDISDDFLELMPLPHRYEGRYLGDAYQREFFAVGDYGFIKFAELVEITDLRGPGFAQPVLPPPPSPAPAPAAVSSTAVAGALSASGVTAFAASRMHRKAAAGAKKKR